MNKSAAQNTPGPDYRMANEPSGEAYDIALHGKPERPWLQPYHKMCVTKLCLIEDAKVIYTFEQTLDILRKFDNMTQGLQKLIYLVVFPDRVYPAWTELNVDFKRPQDDSAWDSLRWLIREAREQCNTLLSLHINMLDAYPESPLWDTYMEHDIIHKQKDGTPSVGTIWDGRQSTPISYYQEWKLGFAQKRIDELIERLPEIQTHTKSIHIDAFQCWENNHVSQPSPYLGHEQERECETIRKIFRYWRDRGIDATAEGHTQKRDEDFAGLQAWCWLPYRPYPDTHIWDFYPPHIYSTASINLAHTLRCASWNVEEGLEELSENLHQLAIDHIRGRDLEAGESVTYPFARAPYAKAKKPEFKALPNPMALPLGWRNDGAVLIRFVDEQPAAWPMPEPWENGTVVRICAITPDGEEDVAVCVVQEGQIVFADGQAGKPYLVIPAR